VSVGTAAQLAAVMKPAEPGSWSKVPDNAAIRTEEADVASKADMLRVLHPRPIAAKKFRRPEPNRTAHCYRPAWLEFGDYYIDKVASSCCMTLPLGAYTFDPTQCALSQTKARKAVATSFWAIRESRPTLVLVGCYSNSGQRPMRSDCPLCANRRHSPKSHVPTPRWSIVAGLNRVAGTVVAPNEHKWWLGQHPGACHGHISSGSTQSTDR